MNATTPASFLNTSTTTTLEEALDAQSLVLIAQEAPASCFWILFGLLGFSGNFALFLIIVRSGTLRSHFYTTTLHLVAADALYSFVVTIVGAKRLTHFLFQLPETCTPAACFPYLFTMFFFENASPAQAFCIALDRMLVVASPTRYPDINPKHLQILNVVAWVTPTVFLCWAATYLNTAPLISNCLFGMTWTSTFTSIVSSTGMALTIFTIVVYSLMLFVLQMRLRNAQRKGKDIKEVKKSLQFRAAITGALMIGVYATVTLTGQLYLYFTGFLPMVIKARVQPWSIVIIIFGNLGTFLISVLRNTIIKTAFRNLIGCKWNKVFPDGTQWSPSALGSAATLRRRMTHTNAVTLT